MPKIVECIPNFSEARRPEVVTAIVEAIKSVAEVSLLDRSSDNDHNRSVLTFAGPPQSVAEAAFRAIKVAGELINMDEHEGAHPRVGATDVVPFVPISDVTMEECVVLARALGARVGRELQIPVYFYEKAAKRPERIRLEKVRKGQYEGLKDEIGIVEERIPDEGPNQMPTMGATVIGARDPLVAFNVYLTTDDVSIAKKIGRDVRYSSGGLRYVKGMGLLVDGRAQVSMNLTNFRKTSVARVVEFIRREAERYGAGIHHSELVGLIPQEALVDAAVWYLQLDQFEKDQVLETRLADAAQKKPDFLDKVADGKPTPGGGSVAAYSGAMGAGLVAMVARLSIGKKKYANVEEEMKEILEESEELREKLTNAVEEDANSFTAIMQAFKLPKGNDEEKVTRSQAIQDATLYASVVPLATAKNALRVMELSLHVAQKGNINAITDGASGAEMARAALNSAGYNVRINLSSLKNKEKAEEFLAELKQLEEKANKISVDLRQVLEERGGLAF
ncbi:MAG TPA: glutamate formimidoyltransferase [Anaerolineales bacterium]|nr:glutamate formimidoyltransferase [Anaerolineales bacterium]